jgi:hypothetical protein
LVGDAKSIDNNIAFAIGAETLISRDVFFAVQSMQDYYEDCPMDGSWRCGASKPVTFMNPFKFFWLTLMPMEPDQKNLSSNVHDIAPPGPRMIPRTARLTVRVWARGHNISLFSGHIL